MNKMQKNYWYFGLMITGRNDSESGLTNYVGCKNRISLNQGMAKEAIPPFF